MNKLLSFQLTKMLVYLIYFCSTFEKRIEKWFRIRVFKQHVKYRVRKDDFNSEISRVVLIAVYPRMPLLNSMKRLVQHTGINGYHPILILNQASDLDQYTNELSRLNCTILERKNIGRDFGAYQCGIKFLQDRRAISNLLCIGFFNDSIIYGATFDWFQDLCSIQSDISALYVNQEIAYHAQSMAMICNLKVIRSKEFLGFWEDYYPSDIRKKVIKNGEVAFSRIMIKSGFEVSDLATRDVKSKAKSIPNKYAQLALQHVIGLTPLTNWFTAQYLKNDSKVFTTISLSPESMKFAVSLALSERNCSHALGPYLSRFFGYPLKLDMLRMGSIGVLEYLEIFAGMKIGNPEANRILSYIRKEGSFNGISGLQKLYRKFNII